VRIVQTKRALRLQASSKTLSNGLRITVLELPHLHAVSHAFLVRSGPRYETKQENGISHLVEHLLFRGTVDHPSSYELNVSVEALGGEVNGLTQRDATTIHMTVPPPAAAQALMLLGEMCTRPLLSGIDIERDVVMEELLDTLDTSGLELDGDTLSRRVLWGEAGLGQPIAGTPENVESFSEAQCRAWFERAFNGDNSVLCIAGPVDSKEMFAVAERAFSLLPRGRALPEPKAPVPPQRAPIQLQEMDDSQVTVLLTFPAPHENDRDFATLLLLKRLLDDGFSTRLRQAVCEQRGLAYSLSANVDAYGDAGALDIELACAPKKMVAAIEQTLATVRELSRVRVPEPELARAKVRHRAELEFALDDPSEMCGWYGAMALMGCSASYEERLAEVLRVTAADILKLAERIFDPTLAVLTLIGPAEESDLRKLELSLGREALSTVWLNEESSDEEEDAFSQAS
jgi:predicted Zn-dependent peptidase